MIKKYHVSKNLFDKNATDTTKGYISGKYLVYTGSTTSNSAFCISEYIPVTPNTSYTLVYGSNNDAPAICFYDIDYNYIIGYKYDTRYVVTETAPNGAAFCRLSYIENNKDQVMLNEGSIALPYEPYYTPYFSEEPYRKRETATDTITTLPKQIIGDGQPIGANLCNISTYTASGQTSKYEYFWNVILSAGTYTFSCRQNNILSSATRNTLFVVIDSNFTYESTAINYHLNEGLHSLTFTLESKKTIMLGCWTNTISNDCVYDEFMLNVGSTALPYQPYAPTIIKGNLSQSGAPTPTTPIYPSECGERTGNLIEFKNKTQEIREVTLTILNGQVSFNGTASQSGGRLTQVSEDPISMSMPLLATASGAMMP